MVNQLGEYKVLFTNRGDSLNHDNKTRVVE